MKQTFNRYAWALVLIAYFAFVGPWLFSADSYIAVAFGMALGVLLVHLALRRYWPSIRAYLRTLA